MAAITGSGVGVRLPGVLDFISHSPEQTRRVGRRLGQLARAGDVALLAGDFGAGKTQLAQGIGWGLAVDRPITSPSFTLVNEYCLPGLDGKQRLYHIDLYRLETRAELLSLGLEAYLEDTEAVTVIEWPERLPAGSVEDHLLVQIGVVSETKRRMQFSASGARYRDLLAAVKAEAFGVER